MTKSNIIRWLAAIVVASAFIFTYSVSSYSAKDAHRVLVFGDSNSWGWEPVAEGFPAGRYSDDERWGGVLQASLGKSSVVVVDGVVSRSTDLPATAAIGTVPAEAFSGKHAIAASVARNVPLDLVVIMLGTNDLQAGRAGEVPRTPDEVAAAAFDLAEIVKQTAQPAFSRYDAPEVLVIAPPPLGDTSTTPLSGLFSVGEIPSQEFGKSFAAEAKRRNMPFFDAASVISTDGIDGIHLTRTQHEKLGKAVAEEAQQLLN